MLDNSRFATVLSKNGQSALQKYHKAKPWESENVTYVYFANVLNLHIFPSPRGLRPCGDADLHFDDVNC